MKRTILTVVAGAAIMTAVGGATANELKPEMVRQATKAAERAIEAIRERRQDVAVRFAERAVLYNPVSAEHRLLLGQAYLQAGRFVSAETAFGDALRLDPQQARATLGLALAQTALGRPEQARDNLASADARIAAADLGLAYALAGDLPRAVELLEPAARAPEANAKTRQNLALVYALSGRWAEARATAAVDLGADRVDQRMVEWAAFVRPRASADQLAGILGIKPMPDAGMPTELALLEAAPAQDAPQAVADAEPIQPVAPVAAEIPAVRPVELAASSITEEKPYYMMQSAADPSAPAAREAVAATGADSSAAAATSVPALLAPTAAPVPAETPAPAVAREVVEKEARPVVTPPAPQASGGYVVQLGAFSSAARLDEAWSHAIRKASWLDRHEAVATRVTPRPGRTFYRLAVSGFATRTDAMEICTRIRSQGGDCFVRATGGDRPVRWAKRSMPQRLASN